MDEKMLHPAVFPGSVPMLYSFRDLDDDAWLEFYGGFAPFLVPSAAGNADEDLNRTVVNMPVVSAAGLEGYIAISAAQRGKIALSGKEPCISVIGFPQRERKFVDAFYFRLVHMFIC